MYKTKNEIKKWIQSFNRGQVERLRADSYVDQINDDDLDGYERFRCGGDWSVELIVPKALLDLLPEWESRNWWEVDLLMNDDGEGIFESEQEALDEYGVETIDEINAHFARRFYDLSLEEEEWWVSLEKEIEGKTGLPFEQFRVNYG